MTTNTVLTILGLISVLIGTWFLTESIIKMKIYSYEISEKNIPIFIKWVLENIFGLDRSKILGYGTHGSEQNEKINNITRPLLGFTLILLGTIFQILGALLT